MSKSNESMICASYKGKGIQCEVKEMKMMD